MAECIQIKPSLSQISGQTELTTDEVKERLGQATGLTPKDVGIILHMKQRGLTLEQISQDTGIELEVLKQFLPEVTQETGKTHEVDDQSKGSYEISLGKRAYTSSSSEDCKTYSRSLPTTTGEAKVPPQPTKTFPKPQQIPTFFYSCLRETNKLDRVSLLTGEEFCHKMPNYQFNIFSRWSELPGGRLLITGGGWEGGSVVVKIDTLRESAVVSQPPMHTARCEHAAVYHSQYLYVLGGYSNYSVLSKCERYSCAQSCWEVLPALPEAGYCMSAVEMDNSLYALGGNDGQSLLDSVQKLSLDSLTWEFMQLKLPQADYSFACFKTDTEVYLVIEETLYSFTPLQVKPIKTIDQDIECSWSYYSKGTLYYERGIGIESLALEI
jgi:hypothetical protein